MGLLAWMKRIFSKKSAPPALTEQDRLLKELASAANIEPYVHALRAQWLSEHAFGLNYTQQVLSDSSGRFPQHAALSGILRRLYGTEAVDLNDKPLFEYATSLTHTSNFAVEGYLYRAKVLMAASHGRQAIASIIRATMSDRPELDLVRWRLAELLKDCALGLSRKAEKELGADDAAVALLLADATSTASSRLLSTEWKARVGEFRPSGADRVAKEIASTKTISSRFAELAQEYSARGSLNPAFVARCRIVSHRSIQPDAISELRAVVVRARTRDADARFRESERLAHEEALAGLGERLRLLKARYDGCLGLIELAGETAAAARKPSEAVEKLKELLRRKPDQTYYAYRAAQIWEDAGRSDLAKPFWIHAARTPGSGWRSRIASVQALARTYSLEAARLRDAPSRAVSNAASSLATYLQDRANDSWELQYWTAGFALDAKAAQLFHLASVHETDSERRETLLQKAVSLYDLADDLNGLKGASGGAPTAVYDPVVIPFTGQPV